MISPGFDRGVLYGSESAMALCHGSLDQILGVRITVVLGSFCVSNRPNIVLLEGAGR